MTTQQKVELLSPVGSFESLHAAIKAGADAIYFGIEQLNMRARSAFAFTINDLKEVKSVCAAHGVKAYITLNTVMYEYDMKLLQMILQEVKNQGIDAVIASDFAVIEYCNQLQIPLHISTQTNVSNIESVQFFARFADVIVLARELTLKQVEQICKEVKRRDIRGISGNPIKIEVFVHGALCMAVSGKCYLSLHEQNASANRGACVQNCRRPYKVTDLETNQELVIDNEYIMSPKDLCTIDFLDQIIESGVSVLKIEGRTKGADYVFTTTRCYREAIDAIAEGSFSAEKVDNWMSELEKVYNRGFWDGYYLGRKLGEWTQNPGSNATEKKVYLGKGSKYYNKTQIGEFLIETGSLKIGDTFLVTSPNFGMVKQTIQTLMVNGEQQETANRGDKVTIPIEEKITPSAKLYKIVDA